MGLFLQKNGRLEEVSEGGRLQSTASALVVCVLSVLFFSTVGSAQEHEAHHHHAHHGMQLDTAGMVMNENTDQLPRGCPRLSGEHEITVRAGKEFAQPGTMFAYDRNEWNFAPCTKLTVTLINTDTVRHQWMLHGLPRYIYPQGMFSLEVAGKGRRTSTFILPPGDKTYLVHCDVSQHMEKGMKAQLKVGAGDGDLPSIPGVTRPRLQDPYALVWNGWTHGAVVLFGIAGVLFVGRSLRLFT